MADAPRRIGKVLLVGAGPGDPGLITLRGVECLRRADVVLYDYLVNPVIAEHAPDCAELICLGKHGGGARFWNQEEINRKLVEYAHAGKTVVRLKGGDPAVFARGGEEVAYLAAHDVPVEIVPGITAALAAGSHAGISLTHRDFASAVALVTGRERPGKIESDIDFEALARFPGTLVFYMGVTTVEHWSRGLLAAGMSGETPVALVRRCSHADQQTIRCRLDDVEERLTPRTKLPPPVIAIVGTAAGQPPLSNWFEQRPLFGQTIAVTRPAHQSQELGKSLAEQGARVVYQPAICLEVPVDRTAIEGVLDQFDQARDTTYDWVVFSSTNGVQHFFDQLFSHGKDVRSLGQVRMATVGPATTAALRQYHVTSDLQPTTFEAETLAADLVSALGPTGGNAAPRVLLVRASRGRDLLAASLIDAGAVVDEVAFYESRDVTELTEDFSAEWSAGRIDWITVTSSAIARSLVARLGKASLQQVKLASLSPITTSTLKELGLTPTVEADASTMSDLVAAMVGFQ